MLVPVKWLKDYINVDESTREIANRVTGSGSHVESISSFKGLSSLVVAKVLDIKKHEKADKLSLVKIDFGEIDTIVTGAKNMEVGDYVVYAKLGSTLPGGITLGEKDFMGIKSKGMLVSYQELGVADNLIPKNSQDRLIILHGNLKAGDDAIKLLDLDDDIIEFEITPNRPDCLSVVGMAREVAAVFEKKIVEPSIEFTKVDENYNQYFEGVEVNSQNVNRFMTSVVKNIEIKDSPLYIQNRLRNAGMRPINNIVDFTNYIMLEYGQPLHAYDLDKIKGKKLIVRDAKNDENITTLDKTVRQLEEGDIIICDMNSNPIGLAGIMGGLDTEVTESTKNILIESASFNQDAIRKTSKRLGLRSEASSRFEKGVTVELSNIAIRRFLNIIESTNSGQVVSGIEDYNNLNKSEKIIELRNSRSNSLLGIHLTPEESKKYLESLELETIIDGDLLKVKIPYFRQDLNIEADLIEEIGRLYGFHNITPKPLGGELTQGKKSKLREFTDKVKNEVYSLGFSEIMTYSFVSKKQYDLLNLKKDSELRNSIEIMNPLGEDFSIMRTTLIGNMLDSIRKNLNNKQNDLRFSEVGNTFTKKDGENIERKLLDISLVGEYDYYDLKDIFEKLLSKLNIQNYKFVRESNNEIFHNGRCAKVIIDKEVVATLGEINPIVLDNYGIEKRVYLLEACLNQLLEHSVDIIKYKKISKYPLVERDIAFVLDEDIDSQNIIDVIKSNGSEYLKFVKLFDTYKGTQIEEGKISRAYKLGFQSDDFTLKDEIIIEIFNSIVKALQDKFEIDLRG